MLVALNGNQHIPSSSALFKAVGSNSVSADLCVVGVVVWLNKRSWQRRRLAG